METVSQKPAAEIVSKERPWRVALKRFDDEGLSYGDTLSKPWLYAAFGLEAPNPMTPYQDAQAVELSFLGAFSEFRQALLVERSMALKTVPHVGYTIVQPPDQTKFAQETFEREMRKAFSRADETLFNVNHAELTDAESRENTEALQHLAGLRAIMTGSRRITDAALKKLMGSSEEGR